MKIRLPALLLALTIVLSVTACTIREETLPTTQVTTVSTETTVGEETTAPAETETMPGVETSPENWDAEPRQTEETEPEEKETETKPAKTEKPKETTPAGKETTPATTAPQEETVPETTEPAPVETEPVKTVEQTDYEKYLAMTGPEQQAFIDSFPTLEDFMAWLEKAKQEYEDKAVGIGGGVIDLDKITGGSAA